MAKNPKMPVKPKKELDSHAVYKGMMAIYSAIPSHQKEAKNAAKSIIEKHLGRKPSSPTKNKNQVKQKGK